MIVVDASVVVKWFAPEPGNAAAKALVGRELVAPALVRVEVASALVKKGMLGELSAADLKGALDLWFGGLAEGQIALIPDDNDLPEACAIALELRHPVPDCLYLAAARRLDSPLITADRKFARRAATTHAPVQVLAEEQP
jgi:predicted nucleic acid-binding protein